MMSSMTANLSATLAAAALVAGARAAILAAT
jgi:hypothetical protein